MCGDAGLGESLDVSFGEMLGLGWVKRLFLCLVSEQMDIGSQP